VGKASGDAGEFKLAHFPVQQDWVLILERV
jgi:hypothetical protein